MSLTSNYGDWDFASPALTSDTDWEPITVQDWANQIEIENRSTATGPLFVSRNRTATTYSAADDQFEIPPGASLNIEIRSSLQPNPLERTFWVHMASGVTNSDRVNLYLQANRGR